MKTKSIVLLIVALGCGLVAMLGVQQVMSGPKAPEMKNPDTIKVLVASKEIEAFSMLDDENTEFKEMFKKDAPKGAITKREQYAESRLRYYAAAGDVIQLSKLTDKNYAPSQEIDPGMRVVTVKVNATKTHSGLIRPGDHVDVVLTYKINRPGQVDRQRTVTILRDVAVFSIDDKRQTNSKEADGSELKAKNISLTVTPQHGNLLMLAANRGTLTLALRRANEREQDKGPLKVTSFDDSIFDNLDTAADANRIGARTRHGKGGFGQFLSGGANGQNAGDKRGGNQNSNDDATAKPKWKLTIYEGKTPRIEEVELPDADGQRGTSSNDG